MPDYVLLLKFTAKGIEKFKDSPNRLGAAKKVCENYKGKLKSYHLTLGRYDGVCLIEAPDDETIAKISLQIGSLGNVKIETLRGFSAEEASSLISSMN